MQTQQRRSITLILTVGHISIRRLRIGCVHYLATTPESTEDRLASLYTKIRGLLLGVFVYFAGKYEDRFRVAIGTATYVPIYVTDQEAQASIEHAVEKRPQLVVVEQFLLET
eukprot:2022216-Pyramimonas_sp.AAC.1